MGCASRMDRASSRLGNEVRALDIEHRSNMTDDVATIVARCRLGKPLDASAAAADRLRHAHGDGPMLSLPTLLFQNGLPDLPRSLIEPHRNRAGVWRIKFSYESGEPLSMDVAQATALASCLREIGEIEFADEVADAITSAKRYASM